MASRNPESTAQVAGHPIHPMLIPFLVATLVSDLIFLRTGNPGWATASLWLLGSALVMAALAAAAGLIDFLGDERIRGLSAAWHHMIGSPSCWRSSTGIAAMPRPSPAFRLEAWCCRSSWC